MFQSVINQPGLSAGRFGTGMWVSLLVHAGVFAGALGLSGRVVEELKRDEPELVFNVALPPKGNPNPPPANTPARQPVPPKPPKPRKDQLVQPKQVPPPPTEAQLAATPPPDDTTEPENDLPYVPGSHPDGVETGGVPGAKFIAGIALGNSLAATGEEVLPFGDGMTPPVLLSGAQIQYTREALQARVEGSLIARCTITREGDVEKCRVIRGLPHMDEAVVGALTSRRYRPVHFQGRPVSVSYTFTVKLALP